MFQLSGEIANQNSFKFGVRPADDGYTFTSPVCAYDPNVYGLFDMGGNVYEWANDASYDGDAQKRSLCGGSYLVTIDGTVGGQVVFTVKELNCL
jgi:formylglycine-generating enzyme required for sulfatase activity